MCRAAEDVIPAFAMLHLHLVGLRHRRRTGHLGIVQPSQLPSRAASAVPVHGNIRLERPRQPRIESFPEGCLGILKGGSLPGGVDVRLHKRRPGDGQEPVRTAVRHFAEVVSLGVV